MQKIKWELVGAERKTLTGLLAKESVRTVLRTVRTLVRDRAEIETQVGARPGDWVGLWRAMQKVVEMAELVEKKEEEGQAQTQRP